MNDPRYMPLYKQAVDLQYKFHDHIGHEHQPSSMVLRNEIHNLIGDIGARKDPQTIENRVKTIQRELQQARYHSDHTINPVHTDYLRHGYEQMRTNLRNFGRY